MNSPRPGFSATSAILRALLVGSLLLSALLFSAPVTHASPLAQDPSGFEVVKLPPEATTAPIELVGAQVAAGGAKMEAALSTLVATSTASKAEALALAESQQMQLSGDRVQILVTTSAQRADAAADAVAAAGGEVTGRANGDTWLQAWAPISALETIAADPMVDYVSRPGEALTTATTTEGSALINAPSWHTLGKTGAGVRVAIIDTGFQGYTSLLGAELPATVTVKNFVDGENDSQVNATTVHGVACAEVVHDIAPNATLYFAKIGTHVDLEEAVNWAKAQNVNIISTSLGWYNLTPGDGTGFFANLVQSARDAGILWTTGAGNDRQAHWGGSFSDGDGDGFHQFVGDQEIDFFGPGVGNDAYFIPAGNLIRVYLRWDDWSAKDQDYDLYVVRWNGSGWDIVGSSTTRQTGGAGQTPTEYVGLVTSGSNTAYGFAIRRHSSSRNVNIEVFAPKVTRLDEIVTARSLSNLADAPAAMTVAAIDVNPTYPQESYSSEGPTNGPGGTAAGGAIKPDISSFANVSTTSYPSPIKFNGTSAATPHVAGAAALVKGEYPGYTPAQIKSYLEGRALEMGPAGKDTLYGRGRLYLGGPPLPASFSHELYLPMLGVQFTLPGQ